MAGSARKGGGHRTKGPGTAGLLGGGLFVSGTFQELLSGASGKIQGSFSVHLGFVFGDFSCYFPGSFFDRFLNRICIVFGKRF